MKNRKLYLISFLFFEIINSKKSLEMKSKLFLYFSINIFMLKIVFIAILFFYKIN